jgi:hypothetical protein
VVMMVDGWWLVGVIHHGVVVACCGGHCGAFERHFRP